VKEEKWSGLGPDVSHRFMLAGVGSYDLQVVHLSLIS
jgi:hypothetical protein